jgi:hypothetical protein
MPLFRSTRITSDASAAMIVALKGIQASADVFAPVKSGVSAVLVIMEMCAVSHRVQHVLQSFLMNRCFDHLESQVE